MAFVVDASVTLPWFLVDERTPFTDALLDSINRLEYWAPAIWCLELPNALLIAERRRRIDPDRRVEALEQAARLRIRIDTSLPDMKTITAIASRRGLSTYDAAYLELASRQRFGLVTLDRDLAQAAMLEGVEVQSQGRLGAQQRRRRYNV